MLPDGGLASPPTQNGPPTSPHQLVPNRDSLRERLPVPALWTWASPAYAVNTRELGYFGDAGS